jgi:plasmid stabilization system protein ParE
VRTIELSTQAETRLQEITDYYLLHESVERTLKVLNSFDAAFVEIGNHPFTCKKFLSNDFINLDIRIYSHFKTFHIYFVEYPEKVRIAEIFHLKQADEKLRLDL